MIISDNCIAGGVEMKRRNLMQGVLAGAAAGLATPAIAQTAPQIRWRLASVFTKALAVQYGTTELIADIVSELTDGNFQIQVYGAGELVPGLQVLDAVGAGTVEAGHTGVYYSIGKSPAFAIPTAIPFGMNARQHNAWMYDGGGIELCNQFLAKHGVYALPAGNTGAQMGGWFRKEINSLDDFKGLKFRVAGLSGDVMAKLGAVPQTIAAGDIYPALERGSLDAAEWVAPHDDERLGFAKVAPYYYLPGFNEGQTMLHALFNLDKWNELPSSYRRALDVATGYANVTMLAKMDARNPAALRRLVAAGTKLRAFPNEVVDAGRVAAGEILDNFAATNDDFRVLYEPYKAFLQDEYTWFSAAEYGYDTMMIRGLRG